MNLKDTWNPVETIPYNRAIVIKTKINSTYLVRYLKQANWHACQGDFDINIEEMLCWRDVIPCNCTYEFKSGEWGHFCIHGKHIINYAADPEKEFKKELERLCKQAK